MYKNPSHTHSRRSGSVSCVYFALECSLNFHPSTDIEELILLSNYTERERERWEKIAYQHDKQRSR